MMVNAMPFTTQPKKKKKTRHWVLCCVTGGGTAFPMASPPCEPTGILVLLKCMTGTTFPGSISQS